MYPGMSSMALLTMEVEGKVRGFEWFECAVFCQPRDEYGPLARLGHPELLGLQYPAFCFVFGAVEPSLATAQKLGVYLPERQHRRHLLENDDLVGVAVIRLDRFEQPSKRLKDQGGSCVVAEGMEILIDPGLVIPVHETMDEVLHGVQSSSTLTTSCDREGLARRSSGEHLDRFRDFVESGFSCNSNVGMNGRKARCVARFTGVPVPFDSDALETQEMCRHVESARASEEIEDLSPVEVVG
jgi:hypothetical protein